MLTFLTMAAALATEPAPSATGTILVDAKQPVEVLVDGSKVGQLFQPSKLSYDLPAGEHTLRVYINAEPEDLDITVPAGGTVGVLVGRTGLSIDLRASSQGQGPVAEGTVPFEVRVVGGTGASLRIGKTRHNVRPGDQLSLDLDAGDHRMSVRNEAGTVVWASGTLRLNGPDLVVMQVSEGRLPEISGQATFNSGG